MLAVLIVDNKFHQSSIAQPSYQKYFQVAYSHHQIFTARAPRLSSAVYPFSHSGGQPFVSFHHTGGISGKKKHVFSTILFRQFQCMPAFPAAANTYDKQDFLHGYRLIGSETCFNAMSQAVCYLSDTYTIKARKDLSEKKNNVK